MGREASLDGRSCAFGPGRVNLIGEHTDYNGGLCLPFAIREGVTVEARPRTDGAIAAEAADLGERDRFAIGEVGDATGWRAFLRGTVAELCRAGLEPPGCEIRIQGNLPQGAGLSSSAALEVALSLALLHLGGHDGAIERTELAKLCSRVENDWAGAHTGLLDQMSSLYGRDGMGMRLDMRTLDVEYVPIEMAGWTLAVIDSGVRHELAESGYNRRREECRQACERLGVEDLSAADPAAAAKLPDPLNRRATHVLEENRRVDLAVDALRAGDWRAVARLLDESHASLRDLYEVSIDRVEETVAFAKRSGALGARIVGGGFGGSVLALYPPGADLPEAAHQVRPGPGGHLRRAVGAG